jgi:phage-related protein
MRKVDEFWFEYAGVRNTDMNVTMLSMPTRLHPAEKGKAQAVLGRDGALWTPDGGYDNIQIGFSCLADGDFNIDAISAWLTGLGELRFSDEPERVYKARVKGGFSRHAKLDRFAAQEFSPAFDCEPYRYKRLLTDDADDITITTSGGAVTSPDMIVAESRPRITIAATGDCAVIIGRQLLSFEGLDNGIVVDSELMDCLSPDGMELLNSKADFDDFPILHRGANIITWSGDVTSVTIRPNWRYL